MYSVEVHKRKYSTQYMKRIWKLRDELSDSRIKWFTQQHCSPTGTPRQIDITLIRQRPRYFHILFRCNFADRKIHVVSMYFFRCNFDGRKILVVSTYFFRCNFSCQIIHVVSTYFFGAISQVKKSMLFPRTFFGVIQLVE